MTIKTLTSTYCKNLRIQKHEKKGITLYQLVAILFVNFSIY